MPEARGSDPEEPPGAQGQVQKLGGAARRSHLMPEARAGSQKEQPEEWWLRRCRRA